MKTTRRQLKQIIKEELQQVLLEQSLLGLGESITGRRPTYTAGNLARQAAIAYGGPALGSIPVRVPRWARLQGGWPDISPWATPGWPGRIRIPARDVLRDYVGPEVARRASQVAGRISRPFVENPGLAPLGVATLTGAERFRDFRDALSRFGDTRQQERTPPTRVSQENPASRPETTASRPPPLAMGTADTQDYMRTQRRIGPESGGGQTAW